MGYMPITPFGRTVDAALLHAQIGTPEPIPAAKIPPIDKWDALRALATARKSFGLSDRDITVLQALLSFLPAKQLDPQAALVIHPSNRSICERLNGMPDSTMRRHLARLVQMGILIRRDSPNGKRYVRRYQGARTAYGFDLSPLVKRYGEFQTAAETERAAQQQVKQLRECVSLMRRDLTALAQYGQTEQPELTVWDQFHDLALLSARALRRKLSLADMEQLHSQLATALEQIKPLLCPPAETVDNSGKTPAQTAEMNSSGAENEQHYQNSTNDSYESEQPAKPQCRSETKADQTDTAPGAMAQKSADPAAASPKADQRPKLPLRLITASCTEIHSYSDAALASWPDLLRAAETIRPMMGIAPPVWEDAKQAMGQAEAAVVLAAMLERFDQIRSPNGYLRHLSTKARAGQFSCAPMVMALSKTQPQRQSHAQAA